MVFDNNNNSSDFGEKMQRCREYMEALESERRKIQVFERELPLCLELVTQAIEGCRQQMSGTTNDYFNGQSECSEQTSSEGPILEEFIPIKRTSSIDEDNDHQEHHHQQLNHKPKNISTKDKSSSSSKKSDWLRSAQLSIQTPDPVELSPKKVPVVEVKRNGCGAFHPFKKEKNPEASPAAGISKLSTPAAADPTAAASSTAETGSGSGGCDGSKSEDKGQSNRKARRCWSPELHRRFLHALQQLGGAHVATPKQIRELMKVDGLTNDEVKSHLQKYRLHTRRPSPTIHNNNNQQTPQFVVVGGIWMPPPEYATMAATSTPTSGDTNNSKGVYAPIASHQPPVAEASISLNKSNSGEKDGGHSHQGSPSTSSSTHTTTASPIF
ncbi:hypothetical protein OSB04_008729 [Centaurea solstitialis]|uniref:HTH myb-type domain-containing protein n=1 Tax=Centaurea solstitialis TaxID=347529 RepID=A0AA38WTB8_9ASTR|nr:hypothetical protein OSB04_008729 [Centaurea solstitialis]